MEQISGQSDRIDKRLLVNHERDNHICNKIRHGLMRIPTLPKRVNMTLDRFFPIALTGGHLSSDDKKSWKAIFLAPSRKDVNLIVLRLVRCTWLRLHCAIAYLSPNLRQFINKA